MARPIKNPHTPRLMDQCDIGWVAGIIEGEGWIDAGQAARNVQIAVQMTDEDTVRRLAEVTGAGTVGGPFHRRDGWKSTWRWTVHQRAEVARLLLAIYPLMGSRRQAKIAEAVEKMTRVRRKSGPRAKVA